MVTVWFILSVVCMRVCVSARVCITLVCCGETPRRIQLHVFGMKVTYDRGQPLCTRRDQHPRMERDTSLKAGS